MLPIGQRDTEFGDVLQKEAAHCLRNEGFVHLAESVAHRRNPGAHGGETRAGVDQLEDDQVGLVPFEHRLQIVHEGPGQQGPERVDGRLAQHVAPERARAVQLVGLAERLPDADARVDHREPQLFHSRVESGVDGVENVMSLRSRGDRERKYRVNVSV